MLLKCLRDRVKIKINKENIMSVKKIKVEEVVVVSGLDKLMEDVSLNSKVSKKMSEKELLKFVWDNFDNELIKSKNGMLKFLRGSGLSCSMDRVFIMYGKVEKEKKVKVVEDKEVKVVEDKVVKVSV